MVGPWAPRRSMPGEYEWPSRCAGTLAREPTGVANLPRPQSRCANGRKPVASSSLPRAVDLYLVALLTRRVAPIYLHRNELLLRCK